MTEPQNAWSQWAKQPPHDLQERMYFWTYMRRDTVWDVCWGCGAAESHNPEWWNSPWFPHRAHIVNQPRREDRRVVILLCPACHGTSHGETYPEHELPSLTTANMLWLKRETDPEFWDLEFLQANSNTILPLAVPPPVQYDEAWQARWGARPTSYYPIKEQSDGTR